ncbi:molecular chaperone HtpG [Hylemonella gracilis]|uniref:Chaperone protein HtpG n=1 Tax=Hylemonella gracilis ATCC 19624 TaxID=887062 RepID=F3KTJ9_9BURK|nr:molecular chaperone HtpG [Hylemonella gracilis]EGI76878.1 heat shock protein 90 [Hylemonella gracilis ATCC 19624]
MSQKHSFQAEVAQLLHLVTHSLYSNKEIFVRELVSNASDACDKLRYEALNNSALYEDAPELRVRIALDKKARTLTITDNGIGMSAQEAIDHLGTIAKSGTKDFMSKLGADKQADAKEQGQLIGQFGVGFYSGFIVADKITVESRRAGLKPEEGVRWTSGGTGDFEVETITRPERGTSVILHLREDESNSADEYLSAWKIKQIIGKYSDHIALPIQMRKEEWKESEEEGKPGEMVTTDEWETVNKASALWTRAKKDITKEEYESFYQGISHDYEAPLAWSHNRVEGSTEYTQLLYVPAKAPYDLWNRDKKGGLKLYVKRVFIMDEAEALLPSYLRFVKGVVDSADLPLNVSRELLQESRDVRAIRDGNTKRVLTLLENLAKHDVPATDASEEDKAEAGKYSKFYAEFGTVLKEGLGEDFANRERLAKLLRYASTTSDTATVSLADYKARMKEGQEAIYYITADTLAAAKNSPQLEVFKKKGIEVLLMTERVDEWALSYLTEFDGTPLQSVAKGAVDLGKLQDEAEKKAAEEAAEAFKPVLAKLKEALKDKTEDVRVTTRLVDSPACLVVKDGEVSNQLARLLKQAGQKAPDSKPILEVNPEHALVKKLDGSVHFHDLAHILYDQALLAEGGLPEDPAAYVKRVNALLV